MHQSFYFWHTQTSKVLSICLTLKKWSRASCFKAFLTLFSSIKRSRGHTLQITTLSWTHPPEDEVGQMIIPATFFDDVSRWNAHTFDKIAAVGSPRLLLPISKSFKVVFFSNALHNAWPPSSPNLGLKYLEEFIMRSFVQGYVNIRCPLKLFGFEAVLCISRPVFTINLNRNVRGNIELVYPPL